MDDYMIGIIVLLVLLIVALIVLCIIVGVQNNGGNSNNSQSGIQIYFDGYSNPLYMEQFTTTITVKLGSFTSQATVNQINSIPKTVYEKAKSQNFIIPCKILQTTQSDSGIKKQYVKRIAVFYDNGEDSGHYISVLNDDSTINGLSFNKTLVDTNTITSSSLTGTSTEIRLHLTDSGVQLQAKPTDNASGQWTKISDIEQAKRPMNIILQNCMWPYNNSSPIYLLYPLSFNTSDNKLLNPKSFRGFAYNIGNSGKWSTLYDAASGDISASTTIYGATYYYKVPSSD